MLRPPLDTGPHALAKLKIHQRAGVRRHGRNVRDGVVHGEDADLIRQLPSGLRLGAGNGHAQWHGRGHRSEQRSTPTPGPSPCTTTRRSAHILPS